MSSFLLDEGCMKRNLFRLFQILSLKRKEGRKQARDVATSWQGRDAITRPLIDLIREFFERKKKTKEINNIISPSQRFFLLSVYQSVIKRKTTENPASRNRTKTTAMIFDVTRVTSMTTPT
jgi:hypothetical protein